MFKILTCRQSFVLFLRLCRCSCLLLSVCKHLSVRMHGNTSGKWQKVRACGQWTIKCANDASVKPRVMTSQSSVVSPKHA